MPNSPSASASDTPRMCTQRLWRGVERMVVPGQHVAMLYLSTMLPLIRQSTGSLT